MSILLYTSFDIDTVLLMEFYTSAIFFWSGSDQPSGLGYPSHFGSHDEQGDVWDSGHSMQMLLQGSRSQLRTAVFPKSYSVLKSNSSLGAIPTNKEKHPTNVNT